ncbi:unnamed protein product [Owenia fusiformis]|uniref:VWFA domain-containing protein n=1 Tax=Owenia fusiformis TaxID=6347 RepID=A0A8S4Q6S7_OWEFU|nr:unnamed protein product [Owenia fusiformis]
MLMVYGLCVLVSMYTSVMSHPHAINPVLIPIQDNGGAYRDPACFNMQIILDVSCFMSAEDLNRAKNITKYIVKEIKSIHDSEANIELTLRKSLKGSQEISSAISLWRFKKIIDAYEGAICKLRPDTYLEETLEVLYLEQILKQILYKKVIRNDTVIPDVILIITDGHKHGYLRNLEHVDIVVDELKENGVEINVIAVPNRSTEELDSLAADYRLYDSNNTFTERRIVNDLTARYSCLPSSSHGYDVPNPYLNNPGDCRDRMLGDVMLRSLKITVLTGRPPDSNISVMTESCPK